MEKKAVILLSGGMDSTTCLAYAIDQGYCCHTISFDYGQKHRAELLASARIANTYKVAAHKVVALSLGDIGGSALTDDRLTIPDYKTKDIIPITYVPARNTVFLAIALGLAEVLNAQSIFIGVSAVDYSGYPDCRPEYIAAFQQMANLATKTGISGHPIEIVTPLITRSKEETIKLGISLGVDYATTVSCYRATNEGLACGCCDACHLRKQGFIAAGIPDTTRYVSK